jgi:hypothetical protein
VKTLQHLSAWQLPLTFDGCDSNVKWYRYNAMAFIYHE